MINKTIIGLAYIFIFYISLASSIDIGDVSIDTEIVPVIENGFNKFTFNPGDVLRINNYGNKGLTGSFRDLQGFDGREPYLIIGRNGMVKEAVFKTGISGEYLLGNERVNLPAGSEVVFKDREGFVRINGNQNINNPTKIDDNEGSSWLFERPGGFRIGNTGLTLERVGVDNGRLFFQQEGNINFNGLIVNNKGVKTYFDFNGRASLDYDGAYISVYPSLDNKELARFVIGSNKAGVNSPAVTFLKDNPYGIVMEGGDHLVFRSYGSDEGSFLRLIEGGRVKRLKKGVQTTVPEIEFYNTFAMNNNGHGAAYDKNVDKLFFSPNKPLINEFGGTGKPVAITVSDGVTIKDGKIVSVTGNNVLAWSNFGEYGYGPDKRYVKYIATSKDPVLRVRHYRRYPALWFGISDIEALNYALSEEGLERYSGINFRTKGRGTTFLSRPIGVRYMYHLLQSRTPHELSKVRTINLGFGYPWGSSGYAESYGMRISLYVGSGQTTGGLRPGLFAHEMAHILDFAGGFKRNGRDFDDDWYDSGIDRHVITSDYSRTGGERISEFVDEFAYNNGRINRYFNGDRKEWFRAALVIAHRHGFFTNERFYEILKIAKLPSDRVSLVKYIKREPVANI